MKWELTALLHRRVCTPYCAGSARWDERKWEDRDSILTHCSLWRNRHFVRRINLGYDTKAMEVNESFHWFQWTLNQALCEISVLLGCDVGGCWAKMQMRKKFFVFSLSCISLHRIKTKSGPRSVPHCWSLTAIYLQISTAYSISYSTSPQARISYDIFYWTTV